jgi:hypothetical protein
MVGSSISATGALDMYDSRVEWAGGEWWVLVEVAGNPRITRDITIAE